MKAGLGQRVTAGVALARREGVGVLAQRLIRYSYMRYGAMLDFPLLTQDVVDAVRSPEQSRQRTEGPLEISWICAPPAAGSGGHTTMFRMVTRLEQAGHRCTIYLYDRYGGSLERQTEVLRRTWPAVRAEVRALPDSLPPCDAYVATSWETAHALAARHATTGKRFYFVQDYEPYFYGRGAEYALAESTYRFGFHGITAGEWLAERLAAAYGMPCDAFPFGADHDVYRVREPARRNGVVFYTKPGVPRRGHSLGVLALERFAAQRPDSEIHFIGAPVGALPFPATVHGTIAPTALNDLYNTCAAGLSLSFTNVSLLPWELLASGVAPVVNDAPHNRRVLRSPAVCWSEPTPDALAQALCKAVDGGGPTPTELAETVQGCSWQTSSDVVVRAFERQLLAAPTARG